jgi:hypothetical protein
VTTGPDPEQEQQLPKWMNLPHLSTMDTTPQEHLEKAIHWTSEAEAMANSIMEGGFSNKAEINLMRGLTELAALQTDLAFTKRTLKRG